MSNLQQADRFSDDRNDSPYWNESVWFSISKPAEKIHGFSARSLDSDHAG